jgi:hypothetical protein
MGYFPQDLKVAQSLMALAGPHAVRVATVLAENCRRAKDEAGLALWNSVLGLVAQLQTRKDEDSSGASARLGIRMLHPAYDFAVPLKV